MKTLSKIAILLITIMSISCSKNDDNLSEEANIRIKTIGINSKENNFIYNDSNQIINYQDIDGFGTQRTYDIIYDDNNRITEESLYSYTYNSLGRISEIENIGGYSDETATIIYNVLGLPARMSFVIQINSGALYITRTFTYDDQNRLIEFAETDNGTESVKNRELITYDNNNNIIEVKNQRSIGEPINYIDSFIKTYTYDIKKNPNKLIAGYIEDDNPISFSFINLHYSTLIIVPNYVAFSLAFVSNNNVLSETRTGISSGQSTSKDYTYTYSNNGFPEIMEVKRTFENVVTDTDYYNWIYETY